MKPAEIGIILLIVVSMLAVLTLLLTGFAWFGGWKRLASAFPKVHASTARRFSFRSASFGHVNYGNCLILSVDGTYLHAAVLFPFRIGHPPISIPWAELRMEPVRYFFWIKVMQFTFPNVPGVRVRMSIPLAMQLLRAAREMAGSRAADVPAEPLFERP